MTCNSEQTVKCSHCQTRLSWLTAHSNLLSTELADEDQTAVEPSHLLYHCLQTPTITVPATATQSYDNFMFNT